MGVGGRKSKGDMWAGKDSHVLKQATASESVKSSSLYFEFVLTVVYEFENKEKTLTIFSKKQCIQCCSILFMDNNDIIIIFIV